MSASERTRFVTIHFAPGPQRPRSDPKVSRFLAVVIALICGAWIFGYGSDSEAQYWLHKDAQEGRAEVTKVLWTGHNSVGYRYTVDGKEYTGASGRSYRDPRYASVQEGGHSPVWYSASHPWFSTLREPEPPSTGFSLIGVTIVLFILFVEARAVLTVIAPTHRWAIDFNNRNIFRPRVRA
jgi:hypothetical protein